MDLIFTQTDGLINLSSLPRDKIKDYSIAKGESFLEAGVGTSVCLLAGVVLGIAAIVTGTILLIKKYKKWEILKDAVFLNPPIKALLGMYLNLCFAAFASIKTAYTPDEVNNIATDSGRLLAEAEFKVDKTGIAVGAL